jgi:diguanylate cyclase (GGDEF)-like protein
MDLDNFKQCNDTYGHQTGDEVLRTLGGIIRRSVRAHTDEGFRFGGDEFAVILFGATAEVGGNIAERMRAEFVAGSTYGTTISIGVVQYARPKSASEFIGQADEALYAAKANGKNTIVVG